MAAGTATVASAAVTSAGSASAPALPLSSSRFGSASASPAAPSVAGATLDGCISTVLVTMAAPAKPSAASDERRVPSARSGAARRVRQHPRAARRWWSRSTAGHIVQTSAKLATARSAVKTANEARLGTTQTSDERNASVSVSVVTAIAPTARRYAHRNRAPASCRAVGGPIHSAWFHASTKMKTVAATHTGSKDSHEPERSTGV
eukprot:6598055-Prymnesium_polylepis.1